MIITRFRFFAFLIAAIAAIPTHLYAQQALGEPASNTTESRKQSATFLTAPSPQTNLTFDRLNAERVYRLQQNNANRELAKALQIGIHRQASDEANPMPILNWVKVNGGFAARFQVTWHSISRHFFFTLTTMTKFSGQLFDQKRAPNFVHLGLQARAWAYSSSPKYKLILMQC